MFNVGVAVCMFSKEKPKDVCRLRLSGVNFVFHSQLFANK